MHHSDKVNTALRYFEWVCQKAGKVSEEPFK